MDGTIHSQISDIIVKDMMEGVIAVNCEGVISYVNNATEMILRKTRDQLEGKSVVSAFFESEINDEFNQTIMDAIYDKDGAVHESLVPYCANGKIIQLHMIASILRENGKKVGVIVVIGDVTEFVEQRARAAEQTQRLLDSVVRTLSQAIDERSSYTANHTRNMVQIAESFLDWLDKTDHPWKFEESRRRSFLMSVWLHDVGKLAVPLEIMDKESKLGAQMKTIEDRFVKISLLDEIAVYRGEITAEERDTRKQERDSALDEIRRINRAEFVPDEKLELLKKIVAGKYCDENGEECPLLTDEEIENLSIRKGTLNDRERSIIQSHAVVTGRILDQIQFPDQYSHVPIWASEHHELLSGRGYPYHLEGNQIPKEVRLLTILDIFEALTAKDRPYKKPMPLEKALSILDSMSSNGDLDGEILALFKESKAWEKITLE